MQDYKPRELPKHLVGFIENQHWIFAKTYAKTYPHEYLVQEHVDSEQFLELTKLINNNGYLEYFYEKPQIYFDFNGYTYWQIENILNRCVIEDTYHIRKLNGRIPENFKE